MRTTLACLSLVWLLGCGGLASRREVGSTIGGGVWRQLSCGRASTSPQRVYSFVAPSAGLYRFTSQTPRNFDGVLAVWNPTTDTQLGCNDDDGGSMRSQLAIELQQGETIEVIQSGYDGRGGEFEIGVSAAREGMTGTLVLEPITTPPMQRRPLPPQRPEGPQALVVDVLARGDTHGAGRIGVVCPAVSALEKFRFVPPSTGHYLFRVDAAQEVYLSVLDAAGAELGCAGVGDESRVQVAVPMTAGVPVRVMVGANRDGPNPYALLATEVSLAPELEAGRAVLFDTGHADTSASLCGAAPGSVDREFTFAPRAEGLYAFAVDLPAVIEVTDGHRRIACIAASPGERNAIFLKARHRYAFVVEMGPSPARTSGVLRLMQAGASTGWSQTDAPLEAMLPLAP